MAYMVGLLGQQSRVTSLRHCKVCLQHSWQHQCITRWLSWLVHTTARVVASHRAATRSTLVLLAEACSMAQVTGGRVPASELFRRCEHAFVATNQRSVQDHLKELLDHGWLTYRRVCWGTGPHRCRAAGVRDCEAPVYLGPAQRV